MAGADLETDPRRVLLSLKEARLRLEAAERAVSEPIALVGIGCRFPGGAHGPEAYWRLLKEGVDAVGPIPADRYDAASYFNPTPGVPGTIYARQGAFLDQIDRFDADFFGISPREAISLDPQQRLLLETAWEALEHAGQAPDELRGARCGVFVGLGRNDYAHRLLGGAPETITTWHATGNGLCYGPGRLAHVLDLKGPNLAVDTACSASLLAVHLACQSLRLRECDVALAGGCHVHLSPQVAIMLSMSRALAPDGRCKAFDAAADGFGQGEGCGVVALRRLSDALTRGDTIIALIRGSAVNHDGHSSGLTVPNQAAQEQVIRDALANARVEPASIGYVEAHGTGTPLGDPIEIDALTAVLSVGLVREEPLLVGSVKTNFGHLEAAAGIAGLIKATLALYHGEIPPHLHFRQPSPRIPWNERAIRIPTEPTPWRRAAAPRLAGVSSFGMSGANAHVVLQEAPAAEPGRAACQRPVHPVALSARSAPALREQARRFAARLSEPDAPELPDIAFTANTGRKHFPLRLGLVAASSAELLRSLEMAASGRSEPTVVSEHDAEPPGVAFLFPGQGSQYAGMGRQLYDSQPLFRRVLERCDEILQPLWGHSLTKIVFASDDRRLDQTLYTQPALFAFEYALAELWRSWGVTPRAVLGHSIGEYAAACVAGVFPFEEGLRLIAERARLMQALPRGAMAAVLAGEDRVRDVIRRYGGDIAVAAVNGPANIVIAGRPEPMVAATAGLRATDAEVRELAVSHAFHSPMMEPMLAAFAEAARRVDCAAPRIPLVSNVTGELHAGAPDVTYWVRHVRQPVRFAAGLDTLARRGCRAFVEIGPGCTLLGMAGRALDGSTPVLLPSLLPSRGDWQSLVQALARLYEFGVPIDWAGFHREDPQRRVSLPTYPFERRRFWPEEPTGSAPARRARGEIPAYRLAWEPQPYPADRARRVSAAPGRWLIFADRGGLGERLARCLRERGDFCMCVEAGPAFSRAGPARWIIDPAHRAGFSRLLAELPEPPHWTGFVLLWNCDNPLGSEPEADDLLAAQTQACGGLIHLVQALVARGVSKTRLWLATRNGMAADTGSPDIAKACLWGLGRVVALEHAELWGGMVDLPSTPAEDDPAALLRELDKDDAEDAILLRDGARFVARIEPLAAPAPESVPVRSDATYLVTGGCGALGVRVARWLFERGARALVLTGRHDPSPAAQQTIGELRRQGATVLALRADVAEVADLRRVFGEIDAALPPLRGVVHAAGVFGHQALAELDIETLHSVLRPKVQGGWVLHRLTASRELDFFICFSSIAALWGSKGQAHYAAANGFLDGLARYRRSCGLPALSVGWGPWEADGMATSEARRQLARIGVRSLVPEDALGALERHLGSKHGQIALADIAWDEFLPVYQAGRQRPLFAKLARSARRDAIPAPSAAELLRPEIASLTPGERREWLIAHLQRALAQVLGLEETKRPETGAGFFRLGLDSTMAVELAGRLSRDLRVPVSPTLIFDHPSIVALAAHLAADVLRWEAPAAPSEPPPRPPPTNSASVASKLARLEALLREVSVKAP